MPASHNEVSLADLPPEIIRMIIPVGPSRRMRHVSIKKIEEKILLLAI